MARTTVTVSTRLDGEGLKRLDSLVEVLAQRSPDVFVSRCEALRHLVTNSASALASSLTVALAHEPGSLPAPRDRGG